MILLHEKRSQSSRMMIYFYFPGRDLCEVYTASGIDCTTEMEHIEFDNMLEVS